MDGTRSLSPPSRGSSAVRRVSPPEGCRDAVGLDEVSRAASTNECARRVLSVVEWCLRSGG